MKKSLFALLLAITISIGVGGVYQTANAETTSPPPQNIYYDGGNDPWW